MKINRIGKHLFDKVCAASRKKQTEDWTLHIEAQFYAHACTMDCAEGAGRVPGSNSWERDSETLSASPAETCLWLWHLPQLLWFL